MSVREGYLSNHTVPHFLLRLGFQKIKLEIKYFIHDSDAKLEIKSNSTPELDSFVTQLFNDKEVLDLIPGSAESIFFQY